MAGNREELERIMVKVKEALNSHDDAEIQASLGEFAQVWEKDGATNQFYDGDLLREFCALATDYYAHTDIILSSHNIAVMRVLPSKLVCNVVKKIVPGQDDEIMGNFIHWLERNKDYASLVQIAEVAPDYFEEIQSVIIEQKQDLKYMLDFMQKYGARADIKRIMSEACEYVGQLNNKKSAKKKYELCKPCWDKIYDLGTNLMDKDSNKKTDKELYLAKY